MSIPLYQSDFYECLLNNNVSRFKELLTPQNIEQTTVSGDGWKGGWKAIHYVCTNSCNHHDNDAFVRWLVEQCGVDINTKTPTGLTPLSLAASSALVSVGRTLLDLGASVETGETGLSPFDYIVKYLNRRSFHLTDKKILDFAWDLLEYGAKCNNTNTYIVKYMVGARECTRQVAVVLIGIKKHHRSRILDVHDINVVKYLARLVWKSQRLRKR